MQIMWDTLQLTLGVPQSGISRGRVRFNKLRLEAPRASCTFMADAFPKSSATPDGQQCREQREHLRSVLLCCQ